VLDIYCAKISPRAYRPAVLPPLAAKELYAQERAGTDVFADALIKQSGIHMPGGFVKLASGETAIVVGGGLNRRDQARAEEVDTVKCRRRKA
jgi:hypothetical protein